MKKRLQKSGPFVTKTLGELTLVDEPSLKHVGIYHDLKKVLLDANSTFRILDEDSPRWDRALFLNLTFWGANSGGDILVDDELPADVVTHVALHHLAAKAVGAKPGDTLTPRALFLGESIASAFDAYLVGRILGHNDASSFLETQVPAMAEAAEGAGLAGEDFDALLQDFSKDPDRAFGDLRSLLYDATLAVFEARSAEAAHAALLTFDERRLAPLLHHYELSNWVLYARAYGAVNPEMDARVLEIDTALRSAKEPVEWLAQSWLTHKTS